MRTAGISSCAKLRIKYNKNRKPSFILRFTQIHVSVYKSNTHTRSDGKGKCIFFLIYAEGQPPLNTLKCHHQNDTNPKPVSVRSGIGPSHPRIRSHNVRKSSRLEHSTSKCSPVCGTRQLFLYGTISFFPLINYELAECGRPASGRELFWLSEALMGKAMVTACL